MTAKNVKMMLKTSSFEKLINIWTFDNLGTEINNLIVIEMSTRLDNYDHS